MTNLAPNYHWSSTILDYLQYSATLAKLSWLVKISKMKTCNICCSGYKGLEDTILEKIQNSMKRRSLCGPLRSHIWLCHPVVGYNDQIWIVGDLGIDLCTNYSRILIISTLCTNYSQTPRRRTARMFLCCFHFWWLRRGSLHFSRGISKMVVSTNWTFIQQDSIPVECIPPAYMFQFQLPPLAVTSRAWVGINTRCH